MKGKDVIDHLINTTGMDIREALQVCREAVAYAEGWVEREEHQK